MEGVYFCNIGCVVGFFCNIGRVAEFIFLSSFFCNKVIVENFTTEVMLQIFLSSSLYDGMAESFAT